jgi:uncharacterized protein YjdB
MRPLSTVRHSALAFLFLRNGVLAPALTFAAVLLALSCGGGGGNTTAPPPPVPVLTTVTVSLSASTIQVGQSETVSASGADQNGASISVGSVTWSSSSPAVASVSAAGAITAVAAGQTIITAAAGIKSGQSTLTVIPVPVASVTVSPATANILVGATQQLTATTLDAGNATLTGRTVTWSSSDATKASVSSTGLVTAVTAGSATITASSEGKNGSSTITVLGNPVASVAVTPSTASMSVSFTQQFTATVLDGGGNVLSGRTITWSSSDATKATVTASGLVTAVAVGSSTITATSEGKSGTAAVTVTLASVATVTILPVSASVAAGSTVVLTATPRDANGNALIGRTFSWSSSNTAIVSGSTTGAVLTALGVAPGTATITATSEGKSGTALVTVTSTAQLCSSATALQLSVGDVVALTAAQKASLCLGGATASEYALIPFNNSTVAANVIPVTLTGTSTTATSSPPAASLQSTLRGTRLRRSVQPPSGSWEAEFRQRERRDLASATERVHGAKRGTSSLTDIPANPVVGSVVQLNANGTGNLCTTAKQLHPARVVTVLPHTIVLVDTLAPSGGYTNAELAAFGTAFDTLGFGLDTLNFGAPTDIDVNGRVAIFFTQGVNQIPQPQNGVVGGYFSARDMYAATASGCIASNEGEIFYLPVPDPNSTINGNYTIKANLAAGVLATLVHEFQHLINSGRRLYVNNVAVTSEEVWLNEGLSHIAEELLYYRMSGNSPRTNIGLSVVQSTQAQADAINTYQSQNLGRLLTYMQSPEANSPYAANGDLATRGAIWQFLRYAADRKGGTERSTWFALVNSATAGQANFNAIFGDITTMARDWAVAQFMDDAGLGATSNYTNPSWNFRTLLPAINNGVWPLLTRSLAVSPVSLTLSGGGAAYLRFRVDAAVFATVAATSSGQAVPSSVDFILVRTH